MVRPDLVAQPSAELWRELVKCCTTVSRKMTETCPQRGGSEFADHRLNTDPVPLPNNCIIVSLSLGEHLCLMTKHIHKHLNANSLFHFIEDSKTRDNLTFFSINHQ